MADRTVKAIIQDAASGDWSIPEFQRQFEWKYEQVAMLCNSLLKGLPIGILTVWKTAEYNDPQICPVTGNIPVWMVDGQQRVTSLCIFAGRKPNWMSSHDWTKVFKKRLFLNINQDGEANIGRLSKRAKLTIPLDEIIHRTPGEAQRYVQEKCSGSEILDDRPSSDMAVDALQILQRSIPVAELGEDNSIEDIAELYRRLNLLGTRLRQAQIMLAYVSQFNRGWVRDEFYPYLERLSDRDDWELDPAHALQVATILAEGKARVGDASKPDMWQSKVLQEWPKIKDAIDTSLVQLWDRGITNQGMIPSSYTLIVLFSMQVKFMKMANYDFDRLFKWFVIANLSSRYGEAPLETLTSDGRDIYDTSDFDEAFQKLTFTWDRGDLKDLIAESFRRNSSQALILHILLWLSEAKDWLGGHSMPALTQASGSLEPHWHHVVPKGWGKDHGFKDCDKTANVTRLCGETNVRKLRAMPPWEYVPKYSIPRDALIEHLIPDIYADKFVNGQPLTRAEFKDFLRKRRDLIVDRGASLLGL